jgi:CRP/FNR family cyclic AMP-dependent transcriptional regulator
MLNTCLPNELADLAIFKGLAPKHLEWFSERVRCRTFPAGTNVIMMEQPGEVVYVILSGTVKIHIEQVDGTDVVLSILGRGDTVGEMSLIDSVGRSASAITLEETSLLWMDRPTFQQAIETIPQLAFNLVRILTARVRLADELIQALATLNVDGRVARQLLAFADKYGADGGNGGTLIPIRLTQGDIADLVGASRKRVNQIMVAFKQYNYISVDSNNHIMVKDRKALAQFCK